MGSCYGSCCCFWLQYGDVFMKLQSLCSRDNFHPFIPCCIKNWLTKSTQFIRLCCKLHNIIRLQAKVLVDALEMVHLSCLISWSIFLGALHCIMLAIRRYQCWGQCIFVRVRLCLQIFFAYACDAVLQWPNSVFAIGNSSGLCYRWPTIPLCLGSKLRQPSLMRLQSKSNRMTFYAKYPWTSDLDFCIHRLR